MYMQTIDRVVRMNHRHTKWCLGKGGLRGLADFQLISMYMFAALHAGGEEEPREGVNQGAAIRPSIFYIRVLL